MSNIKHPHPSGRPKPVANKRGWIYQRQPTVGPLTPSLQSGQRKDTIGFLAPRASSDDDSNGDTQ